MALTGTSSLSLKKSDLTSDRSSGTYRKIQFATKMTGGETSINLASMTLPSSEMPGFVQPTQAEISACQILFNQKNLTLTSSVRGTLIPYMSYVVASSTQINFTDSFGTALPGEIFVGVIDGTNRDGQSPAATSQIITTGTLVAGEDDFAVSSAFPTNQNPSQQLGAVLVYVNGQLMMRNAGNATASPSADGNYEELAGSGGYSSTIRFNVVDPIDDRTVMVVSNGALAEQPSGSMKATIETLAGQQDLVIQTLAEVAGVPTSNFYASPNSVDQLTYANSVISLSNNAALKGVSNTWTANQQFLGKTDGATVAAGYVGQKLTASLSNVTLADVAGTDKTVGTLTLTAGIWMVYAKCTINTPGSTMTYAQAAISTVNNTNNGVSAVRAIHNSITAATLIAPNPLYISTTGQDVYLVAQLVGSGTVPATVASSSELYAVRIA